METARAEGVELVDTGGLLGLVKTALKTALEASDGAADEVAHGLGEQQAIVVTVDLDGSGQPSSARSTPRGGWAGSGLR